MDVNAFDKAFCRTIKYEGAFSNDTADPGGMTFMGISRQNYPGWNGWWIVDEVLKENKHPVFGHNQELNDMVRIFYATEYWTRLQLDFVASLSLDVAVEIFDTAVNLGHVRSIEILQGALNLLNRNATVYEDIVEDGIFGSKSRNALVQYLDNYEPIALVRLMNHLQASYYITMMRRYPHKERFAGWFERT